MRSNSTYDQHVKNFHHSHRFQRNTDLPQLQGLGVLDVGIVPVLDPLAPSGPSASRPQRIIFVDAARSTVIFGTMLLHALLAFGIWETVQPGAFKAIGNGLFRACTPTFFLLFGVMLEWAAVPRRIRTGSMAVSGHLLRRAGLCWLGLIIGMLCCLISGRIPTDQAVAAAVGLTDVPFSSILRFYAVALPLCIPVVLLRPRLGPNLPLYLIAVIWGGAVLMSAPVLPWPQPDSHFAFLCAFLVGHPPLWIAGSVWNDLSIVFLGMFLGYHMRERIAQGLHPVGGAIIFLVVAACVAGIGVCVLTMGVMPAVQGYFGTGMRLRGGCHPLYYLMSTISALSLLWLAQHWFPPRTNRASARVFLSLGRHSLLAFAVGNAVLDLVPPHITLHLETRLALAVAFLLGWLLFIVQIDHLVRRRKQKREPLTAAKGVP